MTNSSRGARPDKRFNSWFPCSILLVGAFTAPAWIPIVMGGVPSRPVLLASPAREYALKSPWDNVRYDVDSSEKSPTQPWKQHGFPTSVDPQAFRTTGGDPNVRSLVRPAFRALGKITSASDMALSRGDSAAAHRVLLALDFWARSNAFEGSRRVHYDILEYDKNPPICEITGEPWNMTPPEPVRSWSESYIQLGPNGYGEPFFLGKMATGAAVSFLQIRNAVSPDCGEVQRIKAWFRGDLMEFQKDFAILCFQSRQLTDYAGRPLPDRQMMLWGWDGAHNKVFCSLVAVTALAIAADDEASFKWAMEAFDFVMNQIENDGTHRATLFEKGGKALLYHNFIADTIVPLAVLADANGHQFLSDLRLTRLIRRVASSIDDPAYFEKATGYPQEHGRLALSGASGWTVIYDARMKDAAVASLASPNRLVYPLYAGSGRRFGGHPKFWQPQQVSPVDDFFGLALLYTGVMVFSLIGSLLSVMCWVRGRKLVAVLMLLPLMWPLGLFQCTRRARVGSWWARETVSNAERMRIIAIPTLLLATILSTGIGFFWTYLFLLIV